VSHLLVVQISLWEDFLIGGMVVSPASMRDRLVKGAGVEQFLHSDKEVQHAALVFQHSIDLSSGI